MRKLSVALLAATAIAMSAPAFAQVAAANNPMTNSASSGTTTMSPPAQATTTAQTDPALDEVVCKNQPPLTGSRIGGSRVCKTNREWLQDEDAINRARGVEDQTKNSLSSGGMSHSVGSAGH